MVKFMRVRTVASVVLVSTAAAVASGVATHAVAGADSSDPACYTSCLPFTPPTTVPNDPSGPKGGTTVTTDPSSSALPFTTSSQSSLPFTGADVIELAAIGAGGVAVGAVLVRRRKTAPER